MKAKPGDFCLLVEPYARDRRHIYRRLAMAYKELARLGFRVKDHRERLENGWNNGESFRAERKPEPECSACTTCAPCD